MKKLIALLSIAGALSTAVLAQNETSCPYTVLTGTQTTSRTLNASTIYQINDCYSVTNGATLTIPAGTVIFAQKSSSAGLYISPGSTLDVQGTSTNPVIFTSDQDPSFRAPGDWDGIVIAGNAINNMPNGYIDIDRTCSGALSAKSNDAENSGIFRYVQIHYAKSGLILASVGSGTTIDHIQVTQASENSFELLGGAVNMEYATSVNPKRSDFWASFGYHGNLQQLLGLRSDASANDANGSYGLRMTHGVLGTSTVPMTRPVVSNMTLIGPRFCNSGSLSTNFTAGVSYKDSGYGAVYNSVITGWQDYGLFVDSKSFSGTTINDVQFAYNSFGPNLLGDYSSDPWFPACESSMGTWLDGGLLPCAEAGNQFSSSPTYTLGYSSSICSSTTPDFRLSGSGLYTPDYSESDLSNAFFNSSFTDRGAFDGTTNWVANWTEFDPQSVNYCPPQPKVAIAKSEKQLQVVVAPNPATGLTTVSFDALVIGTSRVSVLNNASGLTMRTTTFKVVSAGKQRFQIDISGLRIGSYVIRVELEGQAPLHGQLMVR